MSDDWRANWWEDDPNPHVPEVDYEPVEPLELLGPDGELLTRVWPRFGFLAP